MKIVLTTQGYPPTVSGVTLVVQRLARALVSYGHQVTVIAGSDSYEPYVTDDRGVRVVRVESHHNPYWPANPVPLPSSEALERLIDRERPDVVHSHDALPFLPKLARARERLAIPLVATCHYYPSFVASYVSHRELASEMVEGLTWRYSIALYNRLDQVVFATRTHRQRFVEQGLTAPTRIISNGVDSVRYCPIGPTLEVVSGYALPDAPRVLVVGRLAKDKNLEVLIGAMADARRTPLPHLVIVGEGPHRRVLERYAQQVQVADRVHFLGFVPEDDLPALYRSCDAFAISSNHEVQSIPALQAAATGLPMVAAAQGALPEICRDGENGVLVRTASAADFALALDAVLEPEARGRMGEASLRIAVQHDERRTFRAYESLYRAMRGTGVSEVHSADTLTAVGPI